MGFFLDEISISIQHRTPLCVSVIERIIPDIPNPTQDSLFPSFVPKMAEAQKIHGHEVVPASEAPINDDPRIDPSLSPYNEWGMENMHQSELHACFGENMEETF